MWGFFWECLCCKCSASAACPIWTSSLAQAVPSLALNFKLHWSPSTLPQMSTEDTITGTLVPQGTIVGILYCNEGLNTKDLLVVYFVSDCL